MASTYRRVRGAQTSKAFKAARRSRRINDLQSAVGTLMLLLGKPGQGALHMGISALDEKRVATREQVAMRRVVRTKALSNIIERGQRAKASAPAIARARGVLAKTAASRSAAASRSVVPRPVGQRKRDNSNKGGDGQTEGYYRSQGGKRVFVKGYTTPR